MDIIIVTGMSGAGKSQTINFLEDFGYFCVDNLHPKLVENFVDIVSNESQVDKIAMGIDIRVGRAIDYFTNMMDKYKNSNSEINIKCLYLDSKNDVLIKRYKETRRKHPLGENFNFDEAILLERKLTEKIKNNADYIIDTSNLLTRELKENIAEIAIGNAYDDFIISVNSFGFKYGTPKDCDLVFDVRFLPNPYYEVDLRNMTGNDNAIREYVMKHDESQQFKKRLIDMIEFLVPLYKREGKHLLIVGVGCTGGKHRSVTIANELYEYLKEHGYNSRVDHTHIKR